MEEKGEEAAAKVGELQFPFVLNSKNSYRSSSSGFMDLSGLSGSAYKFVSHASCCAISRCVPLQLKQQIMCESRRAENSTPYFFFWIVGLLDEFCRIMNMITLQ
jgi:hypothetical protein